MSCSSRSPDFRRNSLTNGTIVTFALQVINRQRPPSAPPPCSHASPASPCIPVPPLDVAVTSRISPSIWIKSPADRRSRRRSA